MVLTSGDGSHHLTEGDQASFGVEKARGCVVVTVAGEVDIQTAHALRDAVTVAAEFSHLLVIDLTGVTFLDAAGLGVLVEATNRAHGCDGAVTLVGPTGMVSKLLKVTKLDEVFAIHNHVDEAVAALTGGARPEGTHVE
jgi:anti-sigma B factor antagonist